MRPVLLLDVDGVIAPFGGDYSKIHDFDKHLNVYIHKDMPEMIQRLIRVVELQWATAWEESANKELLDPLGLHDPLPYINFNERLYKDGEEAPFFGRGETWKLPWIEKWAERNPDRPLAWLDDEIGLDAQNFAVERDKTTPTAFKRIDPSIGLEDQDVKDIEIWALTKFD